MLVPNSVHYRGVPLYCCHCIQITIIRYAGFFLLYSGLGETNSFIGKGGGDESAPNGSV